MVYQDERLTDDSTEKADGSVDALPTEFKVAEAAHLESLQLRI